MKNIKSTIIATSASEGKILNIAGGTYRIVVSGQETNNDFAVIEMTVPPGAGPVPHSHANIHESFYVVDGEIDFISEKGVISADKATTVTIPKGGEVHCFKNNSTSEATLLCTVIPAGLDLFFMEVAAFLEEAKIVNKDQLNIKKGVVAISQKFGQELLSPDYFTR